MRVSELRTEMIELFEQVDRRFEQVDRRFDAVDARFSEQRAHMDALFEQVRDDIRLLAEALAPLATRVVHLEAAGESARASLDGHDVRLRHLERRHLKRR